VHKTQSPINYHLSKSRRILKNARPLSVSQTPIRSGKNTTTGTLWIIDSIDMRLMLLYTSFETLPTFLSKTGGTNYELSRINLLCSKTVA